MHTDTKYTMENTTVLINYEDIKNNLAYKKNADEIIGKIKDIKSESAKRAIWELVQNARDVANDIDGKKSVNIAIELQDDCLVFSHDGKCFDYTTLLSLIIQVSSKDRVSLNTAKEDEEPPVGQFGTGFCTTHAFGTMITLNGSLKLQNGRYIALQDFELDRQGDSTRLVSSINSQVKELDELVKQEGMRELPNSTTTLKYTFANNNERQYAHIAVKFIEEYVPYVFTLNSIIKSFDVKIKLDDDALVKYNAKYTRQPTTEKFDLFEGLFVLRMLDSRTPSSCKEILYIDCNKLSSTLEVDRKILEGAKIILPVTFYDNEKLITNSVESQFARVFIFFPLIDSHKTWGTTFIIHSPGFTPETERNGILLVSEANSTQENQKLNRKIVDNLNTIIFSFLKENADAVKNVYDLAKLSFPLDKEVEGELTDIQRSNKDYYKDQKELWQSKLIDLPIVKTNECDEALCISKVAFFDLELLKNRDSVNDIYSIVSLFWKNIPLKVNDEYIHWSNTLSNWDNSEGKITWIRLKDIAENLQEYGVLDDTIDKDTLIRFYTFVKSVDSGYFDSFKLLPNLNNKFQTIELLKKNIKLDTYLLEIANDLDLATSNDIIKDDFLFDFKFEEYTGKVLNKALSDKRDDIRERLKKRQTTEVRLSLMNEKERIAFLKLCNIFPKNSQGVRGDLMPLLCNYWQKDIKIKEIEGQGDEHRIYYDDAFLPFLLEDLLIDLQSQDAEWCKTNKSLIIGVVKCGYGLESLKQYIKNYPSFLNQNYQLKKNDDTIYFEESVINEELKEMYNSVFRIANFIISEDNTEINKPKYDIKDELLDRDFYTELSKLIIPEKEQKIKFFFEASERGRNDSSLSREIYTKFVEERNKVGAKSILTEKYKTIVLDIIQRIANDDPSCLYWSKLFEVIGNEKAELFLESASLAKQGVIFKIMMQQNDKDIESIASLIDDNVLMEALKDEKNISLLKKLSESPSELEYLSSNINRIQQVVRDAKDAENARKEEENHKKHIKDIGENIQENILDKLQGYSLFNTSQIIDEQGGQDFVIKKEGNPVYYIEVKSRWSTQTSIRLSKRQTERALDNPLCYTVIIVDLSNRSNRNEYFPDFNSFERFIKVLTSVGDKLESIHSPEGIAIQDVFKIKDYSSTIEQEQFKQGTDFNSFIAYLTDYLTIY